MASDHDTAGQGASAFRAFLRQLPDDIARAREAGLPVVLRVDAPLAPHAQRLMDTLGVPVVVDQLRPATDRRRPVSSIASRARTMGNFAGGLPAAREVETPPEPELRELPPPPTDCAAGECIYQRACPLDGRCVVRDRQEGEEMLERDGLDALERMDRGEPQVEAVPPLAAGSGTSVEQETNGPELAAGGAPTAPAASETARVVRKQWTREKAILAVRARALELGHVPSSLECAGRDIPSASTARELFGSFAEMIEAAGFPRPRRGVRSLPITELPPLPRADSDESRKREEPAVSPGRDVERLGPDGSRSDETDDEVVEAPPRSGGARAPA